MVELLQQQLRVVQDAASAFLSWCGFNAFGLVLLVDELLLLSGDLGQLVVEVVPVE